MSFLSHIGSGSSLQFKMPEKSVTKAKLIEVKRLKFTILTEFATLLRRLDVIVMYLHCILTHLTAAHHAI